MGFMSKLPWVMLIVGFGGLLFMIPMAFGGFEALLNLGVSMATRIVEGTPTYAVWQKIPIPVYLRVRVFNITNPRDIPTGAKPILQEVGPYVYRETLEKVDIKFDEDEDTIQYRQVRYYYFQPDMSKGKESDRVTFLNIAFVGVAKLAHEFTDADFLLQTLDEMLTKKGEKLTRTHTVRELLFDGFTVQSFLELAKDPMVEAAGDINIPSQLLDGKMGILEGRNGSDDGVYKVRSGKEKAEDFGRVFSWNGNKILEKWKGDPCNRLNGTDGIIYQPFITEDTVLQAFVPDICRSLTFKFDKETQQNGIYCLRFRVDKETLHGIDKNPDNWCFCHSENMTHCNVNGIISVASCFEGAPLFMSNPHFYGGDPILQENVIGLKPDFEKHVGYFDLHPVREYIPVMSGASLQVRQRMQFNIELTPWIAMPTFADASYAMVPVLWVEEGGDLDSFTRTMLKLLDIGIKIWKIGKWFWMFFLIIVAVGGIIILKQRKKSQVELLGPRPEDDDISEREEKDGPPPDYIPYD